MDDKQLIAFLRGYTAEIDAAVLELCERHGFGAVMESASAQWRDRDPIGALTVGDCYGTLEQRQARHRSYAREWARAKRARAPLTPMQREARNTYQRDWQRRKRNQRDD